jgi:hypothetical protein
MRAPLYTTIMWDHYTAEHHPEWVTLDENGRQRGTPPYEAGFYRILCVNTPYRDFLKAHIRELLETFPVDGFFLDIVWPVECSCPVCKGKMLERGLEPSDAGQRWQFALETVDEFRRDLSAFIWSITPGCGIFYNGGHVGPQHRATAETFSHWEVESLPSGGWGYLNFPVVTRYARNLGLDVLSHTGKFHTAWGDFHSFKNEAALQYECFRMLAQGAKCMIGDQLHPSGQIDAHVYDLIGQVYAEVEQKEPWCQGARPVTEIGVLTPEEFTGGQAMGLPPAMLGVTRMLEEGAHQFDVLDSLSDFTPYKVLVLPDAIPVNGALAGKLEAYLQGGGALIASFESGLNLEKTAFSLAALGVSLADEGPRDRAGSLVRGRVFRAHDYVEYLLPQGGLAQGLHETEYVLYIKGTEVEALPGSEVLAPKILPYFDRTYRHFCSHRQTPSSGELGGPAVVRKGQAIYFAHPLFTQYNQNAPRWCKTLFLNALALLLPEPLVCHRGPSTLQVSLTEQVSQSEIGQNRRILHALHYIPERRGQDFDVIEDVIPLYNVPFSVRADRPVQRVTCVPEGQALDFRQEGGRVAFTLPELVGHQMIALEF